MSPAPAAAPAGALPTASDLIALRAAAYRGGSPGGRTRATGPQPAGAHAGTQRGRGLDFAELRAYQPGDDIRSLDWRQTARRGRPYTKLFRAERERPVRLMVDLGPGMQFGTRGAFKSVAAARGAALLAWAAAATGDRVSGLVCYGERWSESRPRSRHAGVLALIGQLTTEQCEDAGPAGGFSACLERLARHAASGDRVAIFSDFRQLDAAGETLIRRIGRRADCLLVLVHDPFEAVAPPPGRYPVTDGTRSFWLDFSDPTLRRRHEAEFAAHRERLATLCQQADARLLALATDDAPVATAARLGKALG